MGMIAEGSIEIGIQDHPHHLCQDLVTPDGQTKRPLFPVFLGYVDPSCWLPLVSFLLQCSNDRVKGFQRGAISRFLRHAGRHRASIAVDATVGG